MIKRYAVLLIAFVLLGLNAGAQLCTGSLGDPILNETFGAGHVVLPGYKTSFAYVGGCPPAGKYTLSSFLFGCGDKTWGKMIGDHTGDYNGNYMLVNAESAPGNIYIDTVKNVCDNTVYQLGVYITTVMTKFACNGKPVLPNIHYQVATLSGQVLAADSTGFLPIADEKDWKFYGLSLKTPAGVNNLLVSLTINPAFGCGSAFALDDITLRPCGPAINATIDGGTDPIDVCAGYSNPLVMNAAYSPGFADPVLQWQNSTDTGKTWTDIPGQTGNNFSMPRRTTGTVLYRVAIAERNSINSLQCRVISNTLSTVFILFRTICRRQMFLDALVKIFLSPTRPLATGVLWAGPNGYNSSQTNAVIHAVSYADTGCLPLHAVFLHGCQTLDTFNLKVYPGTTLSVQPAQAICEGQQEQLLASATDSVGYQWTPALGLSNAGIANPVAKPTDSTQYKIMITNRYGCKDSAYVLINVYRNPAANAGPDKTILAGDTAVLNGAVKGTAVNYSWIPAAAISNTHIETPFVYPPANSTYTLQVVSTVGCGTATDDALVKVYSSFLIPNAFTPNGDGRNDKFEILMLDNYKVNHLLIYNRYGQLVFSAKGSYNAWDGRYKGEPQPQGIYVYSLELQAPSRPKIVKKGTLLLIR